MTHYSVQLSFAKNMVRNIGKNIIDKYSQKLFYDA